MTVSLKSPEEIESMRIAGRLAGEVLDFIAPHVKVGVTTGALDALCHDYIVNHQKTIPAPLNYAPPATSRFPSRSVPPSITRFAMAFRVTGC